jgi:integrase
MPTLSKRLTDRSVLQAPHKADRYDMSDGGSGVILRIEASPSKTKSWQTRYRNAGGRQKRMTIGTYPDVRLVDARAKATQIRALAKQGRDPATAEAEAKAAADGELTVGQLIDLFEERHLPQLSTTTSKDYRRYLERDVRPAWGSRKLGSIKRADAAALIEQIAQRARKERGKGVAGNMIRRVLSSMFNRGISWGYLDKNPVTGTKPPVKVQRRETRLAVEDDDGGRAVVGTVADYWAALESVNMTPETRAALKLCLMLGLRVDEAASLRRDHFNEEGKFIHVLGKGDKERTLPLPRLAQEIIAEQENRKRTQNDPTGWLFSQKNIQSDKHITADSLSHAAKRVAIAAQMPELRSHDLRRTAATGLRASGTDYDVVQRILGHTSQDVTAIYVRAELRDEMATGLNAWAERIDQWIGKAS